MNKIIKLALISGILSSILIIMSGFIPESFFENEKDAIIYFLGFLNYLNPIINVSVLIDCIQFLVNYFFWLSIFYIMLWLSGFLI